MSLSARGKVILSDFECANCGHKQMSLYMQTGWKCSSCGAKYKLLGHSIDVDGEVDCEYDMVGFNCIKNDYFDKCENSCPAPYMYCKKHSSKESLEKAKDAIEDAKRRVEDAENDYKRVEESRKTWMVTELSGIDE